MFPTFFLWMPKTFILFISFSYFINKILPVKLNKIKAVVYDNDLYKGKIL